MKKWLLLPAFLPSAFISFGQTTATDFTAADCSSVSHNLFTELNSGKVVVLVWVMPCASCISDAKGAYDAVQSFATSNPGKVLYWMSDDQGNTACSSLSSWASVNNIGPTNLTVFGNTGNTIDETNYGGTGMPHVVVMGGNNHHIYYNMRNGSSDGAAITTAISQGLAALGVSGVDGHAAELTAYPNPAYDKVSVDYTLNEAATVFMDIYNSVGSKVLTVATGRQSAGHHSSDIDFHGKLPVGMYTLRFSTENANRVIKFNVAY
jgi:hypothetical protein